MQQKSDGRQKSGKLKAIMKVEQKFKKIYFEIIDRIENDQSTKKMRMLNKLENSFDKFTFILLSIFHRRLKSPLNIYNNNI